MLLERLLRRFAWFFRLQLILDLQVFRFGELRQNLRLPHRIRFSYKPRANLRSLVRLNQTGYKRERQNENRRPQHSVAGILPLFLGYLTGQRSGACGRLEIHVGVLVRVH